MAQTDNIESSAGAVPDHGHVHGVGDGDHEATFGESSRPANRGEDSVDGVTRGGSLGRSTRRRLPVEYVSVDACLSEVAAREAQFEHHAARARDVLFDRDGALTFGENSLSLGGDGLNRLATQLGAPASYLSRIPATIRNQLLDLDFREAFDDDVEIEILSRGGRLENLSERALCSLPTSEVLVATADAVRGLGSDLRVRRQGDDCIGGVSSIGGVSVQIQLLSISRDRSAAALGDVVEAGLQITHSPFGTEATRIEGFFDRLACRNGMVHRECVGDRGAGRIRRLPLDNANARDLQLDQVRRLATHEWQALASRLAALQAPDHDAIRDVPAVFARWLGQARLSTRLLMPRLREAWEQEGARPTLSGAVNALTDVGTHDRDLPYRARRLLTGLAGLYALQRRHLCPACHSRLMGSAVAA